MIVHLAPAGAGSRSVHSEAASSTQRPRSAPDYASGANPSQMCAGAGVCVRVRVRVCVCACALQPVCRGFFDSDFDLSMELKTSRNPIQRRKTGTHMHTWASACACEQDARASGSAVQVDSVKIILSLTFQSPEAPAYRHRGTASEAARSTPASHANSRRPRR
jgi:hypothetical protein